jgi:HEPN domain-containing protein
MKPPPRAEAERWLTQAKSDLAVQACFRCQQAAEKALKALHYFGGARFVPGHSLVELLAPLVAVDPSLSSHEEAARRLDQLYIPTRYPNGLPGGVPAQVFSHGQAAEAIAQAATFLERAGATIG